MSFSLSEERFNCGMLADTPPESTPLQFLLQIFTFLHFFHFGSERFWGPACSFWGVVSNEAQLVSVFLSLDVHVKYKRKKKGYIYIYHSIECDIL